MALLRKEYFISSYMFLFMQIFQTLIVADPKFPCFFIFGDSFVDNGNNNFLENPAFRADYLPYVIDFPAGPSGRFNNGRNIVDIIAELLGFKKSIPPYANGTTQEILRGLNYGSGGAGILNETATQFGNVLSLSEQISNHEITISRIQKLLQDAAEEHLCSCLYYVGIGTGDYILNYLPQFYSSTSNYTPEQFSALLINQYSAQRLHSDGARKVAVIELGEVGCMPALIAAYGAPSSSSCVKSSNEIVQIFNRDLKLLVHDLNRDFPDAKFVLARDISLNVTTGNIRIMSEACCVVENELCVEGSVPCSNRDEYRFRDNVHPTEVVALAAAGLSAYDIISLT